MVPRTHTFVQNVLSQDYNNEAPPIIERVVRLAHSAISKGNDDTIFHTLTAVTCTLSVFHFFFLLEKEDLHYG